MKRWKCTEQEGVDGWDNKNNPVTRWWLESLHITCSFPKQCIRPKMNLFMALQPKVWGTHSSESRAFLSHPLHAISLCSHTSFFNLRFILASGSKEKFHEKKTSLFFFLTLLKEAYAKVHGDRFFHYHCILKVEFPSHLIQPLNQWSRISEHCHEIWVWALFSKDLIYCQFKKLIVLKRLYIDINWGGIKL